LEERPAHDAGPAPDTAEAQSGYRWQRQTVSAHPDNGWLGTELALVFDAENQPWIAARALPEDKLHLFWRNRDGWQREEVPLAKAGFDPQLHWHNSHLWLSTASQATVDPARLTLSRRTRDGTWAHRVLVEAFDDLPGRYHRTRPDDTHTEFCAYQPSAQRVVWGRVAHSEPFGTQDAGADAGLPQHLDTGSTTTADGGEAGGGTAPLLGQHNGGPWCALSRRHSGVFYNTPINGQVRHGPPDGQATVQAGEGPFTLVDGPDYSWIIRRHNGQLWVNTPGRPATALGPQSGTYRPIAQRYKNGFISHLDEDGTDELQLVAWEVRP
jgi:hypothetical protein